MRKLQTRLLTFIFIAGAINTTGSYAEPACQIKFGPESYEFVDGANYPVLKDQSGFIKPLIFRYHNAYYFSNGMVAVDVEGKAWDEVTWRFIDPEQNFVTELMKIEDLGPFSEGLAARRIGNKWGYIDKTGKVVIPATYDQASMFSAGLASVKLRNKWGYVDSSGKLVIPPEFSETSAFNKNGLAAVRLDDSDKWGLIDKTGRIIAKPQFAEVRPFQNGLASVKIAETGKWGAIDANGHLVIYPQFVDSFSFAHSEFASVRIDDKWGIIDRSGRIVLQPRPELIGTFRDGLAPIMVVLRKKTIISPRGEKLSIHGDREWGYIDENGRVAIKGPFADAYPFEDGLAKVNVPGKGMGFIDTKGLFILDTHFQDLKPFSEGLAAAKLNNRWGFIDHRGNFVVPPIFDDAEPFQNSFSIVTKNKRVAILHKPECVE